MTVGASTEERIEAQIRSQVLETINQQRMTDEQLASKLDLLPSGVQVLRQRKPWPLETAIRVAVALGFAVSLHMEKGSPER